MRQQRELIHEESTEREAVRGPEAFGGHRAMHVEDAFEQLVERFQVRRAELVEHAPDRNA